MGEGLSPADFWPQTPLSFVAIMEGRARAAKRAQELMLAQAWHTEAFAREKRLKPLAKYLAASQPQKQGAAEMMATLRDLHSRGAPMTIKRVEV